MRQRRTQTAVGARPAMPGKQPMALDAVADVAGGLGGGLHPLWTKSEQPCALRQTVGLLGRKNQAKLIAPGPRFQGSVAFATVRESS